MCNATHGGATWGSDATNEAPWSGEQVKGVLGVKRQPGDKREEECSRDSWEHIRSRMSGPRRNYTTGKEVRRLMPQSQSEALSGSAKAVVSGRGQQVSQGPFLHVGGSWVSHLIIADMYWDKFSSIYLKYIISTNHNYQMMLLIFMSELKIYWGKKSANLKANLFMKRHFQFHFNLFLKSSWNDLSIPCMHNISTSRVSTIISVVVTSFTYSVAKHNRFCSFLMICAEELLFLMAINQN